ncbi:hypothetical protein EJB05_11123, partial [Eragrostis curvula]
MRLRLGSRKEKKHSDFVAVAASDAGDSAARLSGAMHERTRTRRFGQWRRLLRCPTCHQPLRTSRLWPWLFAFAKGL